jgi:hypothetical protein
LGYLSISKGANRIQALGSGGKIAPNLLGKLAEVLEIGPDEIHQEAFNDYENWLAWANEPVEPYMVVRLLAAVYQRIELPDDALGPEKAEAFAANIARERGLKVCLVLSRRVSVCYDVEGREYGRMRATPDLPCEPYAVIGGKRVEFDFGGSGLKPIDWPGS